MPNTSARKGAQFERDFCKALSSTLSGGENLYLFRRTAMSGGVATVQENKKGSSVFAGDICASVENANDKHAKRALNFIKQNCVELKNRKDLALDANFMLGEGLLHRIWEKQKELAADVGKVPILCYNDRAKGKYALVEAHKRTNALLSLMSDNCQYISRVVRVGDEYPAHFLPLPSFFELVNGAYK